MFRGNIFMKFMDFSMTYESVTELLNSDMSQELLSAEVSYWGR